MSLVTRIGGLVAATVVLGVLAVTACFAIGGPVGTALVVTLALGSVAAGAAAVAAVRSTATRMRHLAERARTLSRESVDATRLERVAERDEVDVLNNAFVDFSQATYEPIEALTKASESIADGDLTVGIEKQTGAVGSLTDRFVSMRDSLREIVRDVQSGGSDVTAAAEELSASIEEISSSIEQVSATIQEVTRGAQSQSEQVSQASHALSETATQLRRTSEEAQNAAARVSQVNDLAREGRGSAVEASQRMGEVTSSVDRSASVVRALAESVRKITDFVNMIVRISDQTNLLALNAAIEAARAGEHGRGFTVVADEVRKLAEESARSAEEVQRVIAHITSETASVVDSMDAATREVYEGSEVVGRAIRSLEEVAGRVGEVSEIVSRMSTSVREVAERGEGVTRNVESVSSTAEETAASAEEVSAAIEEQTASLEQLASTGQELARNAARSLEGVRRFRVDGGLDRTPRERRFEHEPADMVPMFRPPRQEQRDREPRIPLTRDAEERRRTGGGAR